MIDSTVRLGAPAFFGAELAGPYDTALRSGGRELYLYDLDVADPVDVIPVWRFTRAADRVERSLLRQSKGPLLDLGCGPGRMVRASVVAGRPSLGVDVSRAALELAIAAGLPVLRRSVFDPLPGEGHWSTVLLLDGNIGIGGDPTALLTRAAGLTAPDGRVVVEGSREATVDRSFDAVLMDAGGLRSEPFRWSRVGAWALRGHALRAGLRLSREWSADGRSFAEYAPTTRP